MTQLLGKDSVARRAGVPRRASLDALLRFAWEADVFTAGDALDAVVDRETIKPLLDRLDARAKRILLLRFFRNMTQSQIAEELGISQMHVSRLLSRTLADLRKSLEERSADRSGDVV